MVSTKASINDWLVKRSVFKILSVIFKNLFPYQENIWSFYFWNPTVVLYTHYSIVLTNQHPALELSILCASLSLWTPVIIKHEKTSTQGLQKSEQAADHQHGALQLGPARLIHQQGLRTCGFSSGGTRRLPGAGAQAAQASQRGADGRCRGRAERGEACGPRGARGAAACGIGPHRIRGARSGAG